MTKRILWLVVSCLMALSLVIAACGPAATPTTPTAPSTPTEPTPTAPTTPTTEKPQQEAVKPAGDVPKYGGTVTYRIGSDPTNFDSGTQRRGGSLGGAVYQALLSTDWTRGPA